MTKPARPTNAEGLFADFAVTPADHFRLHFFGAVLVTIEHAASCCGSFEAAMERFPFLAGYNNELAERVGGLSSQEAFAHWCAGLRGWEARAKEHLPLRALRTLFGLEAAAAMAIVMIGLPEEDPRFGALFETLQGTPGQRRPISGLLLHCWRERLPGGDFYALLRRARDLGLLTISNGEATQHDLALEIPPVIWEALRGDAFGSVVPWARYRPPESLLDLDELVLAPKIRAAIEALPDLITTGETRAVIVRGARHSGRRTLLGAFARSMGRCVLELRGAARIEDICWREVTALALLRYALPVIAFDLAPGETLRLPEDWPPSLPLGVVLGRQGGVAGELVSEALTLSVTLPDLEARRTHWQRSLPAAAPELIAQLSVRHRIPSGQIHRAGRLARMRATVAGAREVADTDVLDALRTLNREALDALARRLPAEGDWDCLSASARTLTELQHLESRCRHREHLPAMLDAAPAVGVRALFTGPSGTGKTLAARLLAARLQKDLYQLDLSAVVNKYIGETEKNLSRVLEAAEELDVILLLDEGDALLGQRTDVQNANDRYANLETNFLLQRFESYEGIVLVTTNARAGRIDSAFERRMDVTVEFHPPDEEERWGLWNSHLPQGRDVNEDFLGEVVSRCEFSGGQIRNATLHAALLALDNGGIISTAVLEAAIRREYVKQGGVCPLRHFSEMTGIS
jgi:ATPase family protein associated with various cellular activities (AAA)